MLTAAVDTEELEVALAEEEIKEEKEKEKGEMVKKRPCHRPHGICHIGKTIVKQVFRPG
jgi:hypothetical protein